MWCKNRKKSIKEAAARQKEIDSIPGTAQKPSSSQSTNQYNKSHKPELTKTSSSQDGGKNSKSGNISSSNSSHSSQQQDGRSWSSNNPSSSQQPAPQRVPINKNETAIANLKKDAAERAAKREMKSNEHSKASSSTEAKDSGSVAPQARLTEMVHMLQQGSSVEEVAKSMNMTLDGKTMELLDNLNKQLMLAASINKSKSEESLSGPGHVPDVPNQGYSGGRESHAHARDSHAGLYSSSGNDNSSQGYEDDYREGGFKSDSGGASNAGVHAALAQMLSKQGHSVSMGGNVMASNEQSDNSYYGNRSTEMEGSWGGSSRDPHTPTGIQKPYGGGYSSDDSSQHADTGYYGRSSGPKPLLSIPVDHPPPQKSILKRPSGGSDRGMSGRGNYSHQGGGGW